MSIQSNSESAEVSNEVVGAVGVGRRRLLRAGLAATPVVLAVSGRSAMATSMGCNTGLSPTAWNSISPNGVCINTSHSVKVKGMTKGVSPGNWKPNKGVVCFTKAWPASCVPFDGYVPGGTYSNIAWTDSRWATGTKFNQIFVKSGIAESFSKILIIKSYQGSLEWHLCAAYLNCQTIADYPLTTLEVLNLLDGKIGSRSGVSVEEIKLFLNQTWT